MNKINNFLFMDIIKDIKLLLFFILEQNTREIKTKKGTIWNLEKIETNHVEIKSIGGDNYHTDIQKIIKEFQQYSDFFNETLQQDTEVHKQMYLEHKQCIEGLSSATNSVFAVALTEAGII